MHPQTSQSYGRQTSAQVAKLHLSDQFVCLALIAFLAAFFFLFAMPKFDVSLRHVSSAVSSAPIGRVANTDETHSFRALVALTSLETQGGTAAEVAAAESAAAENASAEEADMSASDLINRWQPYIEEASRRFAVPQAWIRAVIRIESGGRTVLLGQPITSAAGAMGVMQLMRATYDAMSEQHDLGSDPYNVRDNILAGTAYLRELYSRYGYPKLFAAYNAGPKRLDNHLRKGASLPAETRAYIGGVVKQIAQTCTLDRRGSKARQDAADQGCSRP